MKWIVLIVWINGFYLSCHAQQLFKSNQDSVIVMSNMVVSAANLGGLEDFENTLRIYSDSLNLINTKSSLPDFLFNYLFDFEIFTSGYFKLYYQNECYSVRKLVLERVYDKRILERILRFKDTRLDMVYNPEELKEEIGYIPYQSYPDIPYMEISTRQMVKQRLDYLHEKKEYYGQKKN